MATMNPFDLLVDVDAEDPSQLIAAQQQKKNKVVAAAAAAVAAPSRKKASLPAVQRQQQLPSAKLPSKPLPPAQAVRDGRNENSRGRGRGSGRGNERGRSGDGFNQEFVSNENSFSNSRGPIGQGSFEGGDIGKSSERRGYGGPRTYNRGVGGGGGRRSGFNDGEVADEERPRRTYEHRSGTGHGSEFKHGGAGRANWGTPTDEISQVTEEVVENEEKVEKSLQAEDAVDDKKESPVNESKEKEPDEDKEMTLEEYEKVLEERRKALQVLKTEERKVDIDKEFKSMQQLSSKKSNDDVFIKLGSDKDKRKEVAEKEEKAKKSVSISEFLKPTEGDMYVNSGGCGRGQGRGFRGFGGGNPISNAAAPAIEDPGQFPTLGAK